MTRPCARRGLHAGAAGPGEHALVQDTAWPGYEEVRRWIVEGYDTLLDEVDELEMVPTSPPTWSLCRWGSAALAQGPSWRSYRRPGTRRDAEACSPWSRTPPTA